MSMYVIIEESGGQRRVAEGDEILIDLVDGGKVAAGTTITFDKVLLVSGEGVANGARIGAPYLQGVTVTAEVTSPVEQGDKLYIYKHAAKKTYKRKTGHRQKYTQVKVTGIKA